MNWFQNFMRGRYGTDKLNLAMLILAMIFTIISGFIHIGFLRSLLTWLGFVLLILCFFRMFSRQIYKRQQEYFKFLRFYSPIADKFRRTKMHSQDRKTHKYYTCPSCKQKLRLPKGKGKISITCPKCQQQFIKKT